MAIELSSEDTFTLTEIGYASVMYGLSANVEPIFTALDRLYPENTAGAIGHAITFLNSGDYNAAIDVLQRSLQECSTNVEEAKAILMLAMHMGGRTDEAETIAEEVDQDAGIANNMANSLFVEKQQS